MIVYVQVQHSLIVNMCVCVCVCINTWRIAVYNLVCVCVGGKAGALHTAVPMRRVEEAKEGEEREKGPGTRTMAHTQSLGSQRYTLTYTLARSLAQSLTSCAFLDCCCCCSYFPPLFTAVN